MKKNFVVAIDSFKGSLSSMEAGHIVEKAIEDTFDNASVKVFPLADGGEGTVDALADGLGGGIVLTEVTGPLGEKVQSRYGWLPELKLAIIEMADAAGLPMVPKEKRNPMNTTTYGLGELMLQAAEHGAREFIIGIGGSATNDAGLGMLTALGVRFTNAEGAPVGIYGRDLTDVASIDVSGLADCIKESRIHVACDVTNPLCGENGCSVVYGPQKGATPEIVRSMDSAIHHFALLGESMLGFTGAETPGAGAAGGLGYAYAAYLGAELKPGISLVLDALDIESSLKEVDVLITGEGRMDRQTAMGKGPAGVAQLAKKLSGALTIAFCGCASDDAEMVNDSGIDAYFPILHHAGTAEEAMEPDVARSNLYRTAVQVFRLMKSQ